jgi:hypothetical protein
MTRSVAPRSCGYCGGRDLSREHIFPSWLRAEFGSLPARSVVTADDHFRTPNEQIDHGLVSRNNGRPFVNAIERQVCRTCNSGWMSQIADNARPGLLKFLHDPSTTLGEAEALGVAKWIILAAMTFELRERYPGFSFEERSQYQTTGAFPRTTSAWIGVGHGSRWLARHVRHGMVFEDQHGQFHHKLNAFLLGFKPLTGRRIRRVKAKLSDNRMDLLERQLVTRGDRVAINLRLSATGQHQVSA